MSSQMWPVLGVWDGSRRQQEHDGHHSIAIPRYRDPSAGYHLQALPTGERPLSRIPSLHRWLDWTQHYLGSTPYQRSTTWPWNTKSTSSWAATTWTEERCLDLFTKQYRFPANILRMPIGQDHNIAGKCVIHVQGACTPDQRWPPQDKLCPPKSIRDIQASRRSAKNGRSHPASCRLGGTPRNDASQPCSKHGVIRRADGES